MLVHLIVGLQGSHKGKYVVFKHWERIHESHKIRNLTQILGSDNIICCYRKVVFSMKILQILQSQYLFVV